ncbi:hypothetical protein GEO21_22180 [Sphingobacterium faecium]|nr:hypothetical protein [Sphingobacterium faecium]
MHNILTDLPGVEDRAFYYILPIERLSIEEKISIGDVVIYPRGTVNIDQLLASNLSLDDRKSQIDKLKENTIICFRSKSPVEFSADPGNNFNLLTFAINYATPILDYIIFTFCDITDSKYLPGRAGQISSGETLLLIFDDLGSPFTRIISEKVHTNTITYGKGLTIKKELQLDPYPLSTSDINEAGNIAKHCLRKYTQILESNSDTEKFIQIMMLFEFIASPNEYEKFQNVKSKIISHIAQNIQQIHEISNEFKYYSSGDSTNGLRTQIFHTGKRIEELLTKDELKNIFIKLHKYIALCIKDLIINYNKNWAEIENIRTEKREKAEKNKIKIIEDNYSETLVVIDADFLGLCIQNDQEFYKKIYPDRKLDNIQLGKLCYEILLNTRLIETDKIFTFVIFHSQIYNSFPFVKETFKEMNEKKLEVENLTFEFYTINTETTENLFHSINYLLESLNQNRKTIVDRASIIKKVIFCADNPSYKEVLKTMNSNGTKEIIMIRNTHESEMNLEDIHYFFVSHLVGKALGLKKEEL